jgi:hypothetical protein
MATPINTTLPPKMTFGRLRSFLHAIQEDLSPATGPRSATSLIDAPV